ncbi:hypothetical protein EBB07_28515 [Paenibacillaceae bacterium]|nr:hypothetical protein EBB07_28515 [Paenibacillaceae bacterium]
MWRTYKHEEKVEAGKVEVNVIFNEDDWNHIIQNVRFVPKGKRKMIFLDSQINEEYSYYILNRDDRDKYMMKRYIEIVGIEVLNNALNAAWEASKPKLINADDYRIESGGTN